MGKALTYLIATFWFINGFYCKILDRVPRHEEIVAQILGSDYSRFFTVLIGFSEIIMVVWILSSFKKRLNSIIQIGVIGIMNVLEFILVPELLLWGKLNIVFATFFILMIYYNEFILSKKIIPIQRNV